MSQAKKLIEVALPLEAINVASAREKSIRHGHPSTLHLWWARRPLAAARAVIFTSLVDDPDDPHADPDFVAACRDLPKGANVEATGDTPRMRLFDFIERLVTWEATTDEAILNQARRLIQLATQGNPPPLLDPFAGGGSIPLEAQRLGLEAHASDLNPVAVMINKAQIEIPPRFANKPPVNPRDRATLTPSTSAAGRGGQDTTWTGAAGLAADVRYYGEWMRDKAFERIGHLYPTINNKTVIAWLWTRTVKCPNPACGIEMPLLSSFVLSSKKGKEHYIVPIVSNKNVIFEVTKLPPKKYDNPKKGLKRGTSGIFECVNCGTITTRNYVAREGISKRIKAIPTAIVLEGSSGREYTSKEDFSIPHNLPSVDITGLNGEFPPNPRDLWCRNFGLTTPADLFTPRQLVALTTFSDLVAEARQEALTDAINAGLADDDVPLRDGGQGARAYAEAVSVYLSFVVDRCTDYWSTISTWHTNNQQIRATFARQALPMAWDYTEPNPFSDSSGGWNSLHKATLKGMHAIVASITGYSKQSNAATISTTKGFLVSTDPPYYDNIGYADLSDYFYVWLRRSLRDIYPDIFGTLLVPKEPELIASAYRHGGKEAANEHFESGLHQTFINIRRFITPDYPLTVYYAFKQQDADVLGSNANGAKTSTGWETMLTSLMDAGFSIDGTWPIRTEQHHRMVAHGTNALASSIVLVCRARAVDAPSTSRRAFVDALRRELPAALQAMQSGNIAPVDLAQASIGPGMAIYSRYTQVLEADGTPMPVRTALALINQELDAYLAEQDGDIDGDTRFAVDWFTQFGFEAGDFGQADVLSRAKNTSVPAVMEAGLVEGGKGKVTLRHWRAYDPSDIDKVLKRPTVWQATHHLIEQLHHHGETGAAMLLNKLPSQAAAEARQLAYRLYSICERKNWADNARDYNALVVSWSGIAEEAARLRELAASGEATNQMNLFDE